MSREVEREYRQFIRGLLPLADKFPKKHGSWARVKLTDGRSVYIDTWNRQASLVASQDDPDYWLGFKGDDRIAAIGIDFGGVKVYDEGTMRDVARELKLKEVAA